MKLFSYDTPKFSTPEITHAFLEGDELVLHDSDARITRLALDQLHEALSGDFLSTYGALEASRLVKLDIHSRPYSVNPLQGLALLTYLVVATCCFPFILFPTIMAAASPNADNTRAVNLIGGYLYSIAAAAFHLLPSTAFDDSTATLVNNMKVAKENLDSVTDALYRHSCGADTLIKAPMNLIDHREVLGKLIADFETSVSTAELPYQKPSWI